MCVCVCVCTYWRDTSVDTEEPAVGSPYLLISVSIEEDELRLTAEQERRLVKSGW